jgi:hypothetical protein
MFKCVKSISTDQLVCEDQVCVLQILALFNDICFKYEDYMLMNGSMIVNNEQKKILKKVVVSLIKMVSQHLSKTTKAMQNFRIAGLHKAGVLTHIPDVQWRGQLHPLVDLFLPKGNFPL